MSSIFVIWLDRDEARIFQFSQDKMERKNLHARHTDHHTHQADQLDQAQRDKHFYGEVVEKLAGAAQILILGPGVAKHHFQTYLSEHQPALAKKIVGCETTDHPTDHQIAALAKKFFKMGAPVATTA